MSAAAKIIAPKQGGSPSIAREEIFVAQAGDPVGQLQQMLATRMTVLSIDDIAAPVDRFEAIASRLSRFAAFPAILVATVAIIQGVRAAF